MIGFIKGKVVSASDGTVLIENNGIGYEILCSSSAFIRLMNEGQGCLWTYMQVKEDGICLFGFDTPEEKRMFLKLITVSGVGAKVAINILSGISLNELAVAIATSDVKTLTRIKGLGKKTSERIIVELRESVKGAELGEPLFAPSVVSSNEDGQNAVTALISLGYSRAIATNAVEKAISGGAKSVEDIIAGALRSL